MRHITKAVTLSSLVLFAALFASPSTQAESAQVLDVSACAVLDGNGNFYRTTEKNKAVYNKAGDILKCDAKDIPNDAKKTVHYDKASTGYRCSTGQHMTDDWNLVVSASGNATLTCKFKFPKP